MLGTAAVVALVMSGSGAAQMTEGGPAAAASIVDGGAATGALDFGLLDGGASPAAAAPVPVPNGCSGKPGGFQQLCWGMSQDEAATALGGTESKGLEVPPVKPDGEDLLIHDVKIGDDGFKGHAYFVGGKLVEVEVYKGWNEPSPRALELFQRLQGALTEKYGKPRAKNRGLILGQAEEKAIFYGTAESASVWNTGDTTITLLAHGDRHTLEVLLRYAQPGAEKVLKSRENGKQGAVQSGATKDP